MNLGNYTNIKSILRIGELSPVEISIVIPTYKRPKGLRRAITSIISQETNVKFNVIIVDNSDNEDDFSVTEALVKELNTSNKIAYFRNEKNIGCFPNWHRAFELGNGEYIIMLHADDYMLPGSIDEIYHMFHSNPDIDALFCNRFSLKIGESIPDISVAATTRSGKIKKFIKRLITTNKQIHHVRLRDFVFGFCFCATTIFGIKKSVITEDMNIPNWDATESADSHFAMQICRTHNLYFYDKLLGVKTEEPDNQGHRKDITIPVVIHNKEQFSVFKHDNIYTRFLVNMRIYNVANGFRIAHEPEIKAILPSYVYNKWSQRLWGYIRKFYMIGFKRR